MEHKREISYTKEIKNDVRELVKNTKYGVFSVKDKLDANIARNYLYSKGYQVSLLQNEDSYQIEYKSTNKKIYKRWKGVI